MLTELQRAQREQVVLKLAKLGLSQTDMAEIPGFSLAMVNEIITRLRREKKLEKTNSHSRQWLISHGQPVVGDEVIAQVLQEPVTVQERVYTTAEVAQELGVIPQTVIYLCGRGVIPHIRQGNARRKHYLFSQQGIDAARQHLCRPAKCIICGANILPRKEKRGIKKITCGNLKCQKRRERDFQKPLKLQWHKELVSEISAHPIPPDDERISIVRAAAICGIKYPLLDFLARRQMVKSWFKKKKRGYRDRVRFFSTAQMHILRSVYQRHFPTCEAV